MHISPLDVVRAGSAEKLPLEECFSLLRESFQNSARKAALQSPLQVALPASTSFDREPPAVLSGGTDAAPGLPAATKKSAAVLPQPVPDSDEDDVDFDPLTAAAHPSLGAASASVGAGGGGGLSGPGGGERGLLQAARPASGLAFADLPSPPPNRLFIPDAPVESWTDRKPWILRTFTSARNIPVSTSMVDDVGDLSTSNSVRVDRTQTRLAQLGAAEAQEHESKVEFLSQKQLVAKLEKLNDALLEAWDREDKVGSLKIVIQCVKILRDTSVPQCYPSVFVLVSEVLDTFGRLVFERIRRKAVDIDPSNGKPLWKLGDQFSPDQVSAEAKEMCKNWIFKISSIRELLPRLYVELCLLRLYRFLDPAACSSILYRVAYQARGVGNPLIANYLRLYVLRTALFLVPVSDPYLRFLMVDAVRCAANGLHAPVIEFVMSCMGHAKVDLNEALRVYRELVLSPDAKGQPSKIYAEKQQQHHPQKMSGSLTAAGATDDFADMDLDADDHRPKSMVLRMMLRGFHFSHVAPFIDEVYPLAKDAGVVCDLCGKLADGTLSAFAVVKKLARDSFKEASTVPESEPRRFIRKITNTIRFILKNFGPNELDEILGELRQRVSAKDNEVLKELVQVVLDSRFTLREILAMEHFLPLLELFDKASRNDMYKSILMVFQQQPSEADRTVDDPVLTHTLFGIAKALHDSTDLLSMEDEKRQLSELVVRFVRSVSSPDLEVLLSFLVDCRAAFPRFDLVLKELVLQAMCLVLSAKVGSSSSSAPSLGSGGGSTPAFLTPVSQATKSLVAFAHITIPVIESTVERLRLYTALGLVCLSRGLVSACETLMRHAITTVTELEDEDLKEMQLLHQGPTNWPQAEAAIRSLALALVVVPGHPDKGGLYLFRGLVVAVSDLQDASVRLRLAICLLRNLATLAQRTLPFHFAGVDSNDTLFMCGQNYRDEIAMVASELREHGANASHQLAASSETGTGAQRKREAEADRQQWDQVVGQYFA